MILVIAHRGASHYKPENSLEAFELAVQQGAHMVEMDVRRNAKGEFVVKHGPIAETDTDLLLLKDALTALNGKVKFNIELKESGFEREVMELILSLAAPQDIFISSFNPKTLEAVKTNFANVKVGRIVGPEGWKNIWRMGLFLLSPKRIIEFCDFLVLHKSLYNLNPVDKFIWFTKPVYVWTVDDQASLERLAKDSRISGIITNVPDVCGKIIAHSSLL
jgi:glycerophosphoryl diester phosphodiesterase